MSDDDILIDERIEYPEPKHHLMVMMSKEKYQAMRDHINRLERGLQFAILHIEGGDDLIFSTRNRTAALQILRATLDGEDRITEVMLDREWRNERGEG